MNKPMNSITSEVTNPSPKDIKAFLLAEYPTLRDEILKRTDIQHQLISLALIATGTFLAIESVTVKLAYPFLALFLSFAWVQNDIRIRQLGTYISEKIEGRFGNIGWEHFLTPMRDWGKIGNLAYFASLGILCGTQILIIILVSPQITSFTTLDKVLLCVDGLVTILTIILLGTHLIEKPQRMEK